VNAFQSSPDQRQPAPVHNVILLAWMWAAFTLFHQGHDNHWARTPLEAIESASAVAVLVGPTRLTRFLLLTIFQAANLWWLMPEPTNHAIFALIVDVTIVAAAIGLVLSRGVRQGFDGAAWYRSFAPAIRVSVILLYVFATLAKINTAFLDPAQSCGAHHYAVLRGHFGAVGIWLPEGAAVALAAIAATLVIEGGIPVLLTFRRTRPLGVMVALVFHYLLGLNGFYDFSSMIFAVLLLFTPDAFGAIVQRVWLESRLRHAIGRARERLAFTGALAPLLAAGAVVVLIALPGTTGSGFLARRFSYGRSTAVSSYCWRCQCSPAPEPRSPLTDNAFSAASVCSQSRHCSWSLTPCARTSDSRPTARLRCSATCGLNGALPITW
jgi:hypothetical protein